MMQESNTGPQVHRTSGKSWWSAAFFCVWGIGWCVTAQAAETSLPNYSAASELREDSTLRAVAFRSAEVGVTVGDRGAIFRTTNGGVTWLPCDSKVESQLSDVMWINDRRVVAVGGSYDTITQLSRGAVVISDDAGEHWRRTADQELARLHRVISRSDKSHVVAAGDWSPVSMTEHYASSNGGSTWSIDEERSNVASEVREPSALELRQWAASTGATAPIRSACRPTENLLWAVGDHGIIYHSSDAGRSWSCQRGDGRQTAVLVVAANANTVPWSLVGNEALESGHRIAIVLTDSSSLSKTDPTRPRNIDLARHAAMTLGAAGVDVAEPAEIAALIAAHRPRVVVLDRALSQSARDQISEAAIELAVQRIIVASVDGTGGETRLHRSAMLPRSGVLAGDLWQDALNLVTPGASVPLSLSLKRTYDAVGATLRGESVTAGMALARGCQITAERPQATRRQLQIIQARLSEPQRIEQVIASSRTEEAMVTGIQGLIAQSAAEDRLRLGWSIYCDAIASNNATLQRVVLQTLAGHAEFGSVVPLARLRLDAIEHSQEWRRLLRDKPFSAGGLVAIDDPTRGGIQGSETVAVSPFQSQFQQTQSGFADESRVVMASATSPLIVPDMAPETAIPIAATSLRGLTFPQGRVTQTKRTTEVDLAWEFHPLVLLARDSFRRQSSVDDLQSVDENNGNLQRLAQSTLADQWNRLASKPTVFAKTTSSPPRLDGLLNDACWGTAARSVNELQLRLAYDSQFLYVAATVPSERLRDTSLSTNVTTSVRDNDLTNVDRLAIAFDVDRDLMTAYRLQTTQDRLTRDAIDDQLQWQPTWYVASANDGDSIVLEMAFLFSDLVAGPVTPGDSWLCEVNCLAAGTPSTVETMPSPAGWIRFGFE